MSSSGEPCPCPCQNLLLLSVLHKSVHAAPEHLRVLALSDSVSQYRRRPSLPAIDSIFLKPTYLTYADALPYSVGRYYCGSIDMCRCDRKL